MFSLNHIIRQEKIRYLETMGMGGYKLIPINKNEMIKDNMKQTLRGESFE